MKDLDTLLPRVMEWASACPEPTVLRHLRDKAIEFCQRTRIWRESDSFTLGADDGCEVVALEPNTALFEISHARFEDTDLEPRTIDWLDQYEPGWRERSGQPRWITQSSPDTLRIAPIPSEAGTLTLQLILEPSIDADQLPDVLVDKYGHVIAAGALASILALPTAFTNLNLAAVHAASYADALAHFAARVPLGQQRAKRRTKGGGFF